MNDFERRIAALSPEQRDLLMRRIKDRGGPAAPPPLLPERPRLPERPPDRFAPVPPTDFQEVLWLGRSGVFDVGGCGANIYIEQEYQGSLWPFAHRLTRALRTVIGRHEMLRTIVLPDGHLQLLPEVPPFEVEAEDLSGRSSAWTEERLRSVRHEMRYAKRPLDRWPLFEAVLHQINGGRIRLHWRFEAILIDGTARARLFEELSQLLNFPDRELAPLEVSFLDYARALAAFRETAAYSRSRAYWLSQLPSLPPPPVLPLARPLTPDTVPRIVKRQPEVLDRQSWEGFSQRARNAGLSPTSALTAAFAEVLRLWSARPDFSIGCGGSYRPDLHPHMARSLGSFTIIHLLAAQDGPGAFQERAQRLQARIAADLDHQEFSGHQVWREYNRRHRMGARALLPIHFNSVVEYSHPAAPAEETSPRPAAPAPGEAPPRLDFREIELMLSLPQALILWVATLNGQGGLELVSQAVEEVFPEDFIPSLIESYRDLLTRLAAGEEAWNEERPALRVGAWNVPEPWLADLTGALGYGAHPRFVERALEQHPAVRQAAVAWVAPGEEPGRLVAWIVPEDGHPPNEEELRRDLRARLPEALIPDAFVGLEELPRTADGALGSAALPPPPVAVRGEWGEIETELAALWQEVLGRRPATLAEDFFALGGDSVSAVRLLSRITARWGRIDPGALFARPTLSGLGATVRRLALAAPPEETPELRPRTRRTPHPKEKRAQVFYFHPPVRPFGSSCAVVNSCLNETLEDLGYQVHGVYAEGRNPSSADVLVPLRAVERRFQSRSLPPAGLTVHCDFGLQVSPVRRRGAQKNVVFFHGFAGSPGEWAGNPAIDRYWGNSAYTGDVVQSLLALPDWRRQRILDSRAFGIVSHLTLALPCLEEPAGALEEGSGDLPRHAREAIDRGDVLGHAVTAEKVDESALYSILLRLNQLAQERGLGRRFRVFVADHMFRRIQAALDLPAEQYPLEMRFFRDNLTALGLTAADLLIPIPHLRQSALFEILRACRFGVFYNTIPESFGLYALESVFHGCPIYTNGIGNLRYLLPEGCGIHVHESEAMGFGDPEAYLPVAEAIYRNTVTDPASAGEECRRGAGLIARRYNREAFRRDVAAELGRLDFHPEPADFASLTVRLSPLVRLWNPETRRALTDHSLRQLSETERDAVEASLGRTCGEIRPSARSREIETLQNLFLTGILALSPSGHPAPDRALRGDYE
ncbi:MAG TPA: condensation domain-containing protein [Thermoanaerobaculia bacterium]|nr:condensation domain-containing protein [Thermoanaerobaculia bacterium]